MEVWNSVYLYLKGGVALFLTESPRGTSEILLGQRKWIKIFKWWEKRVFFVVVTLGLNQNFENPSQQLFCASSQTSVWIQSKNQRSVWSWCRTTIENQFLQLSKLPAQNWFGLLVHISVFFCTFKSGL